MVFLKKIICYFLGHDFTLMQEIAWKDYCKDFCRRCGHIHPEKYPSNITINKDEVSGDVSIVVKGGSCGDGDSGTTKDIYTD